jgi:hypothetical protein
LGHIEKHDRANEQIGATFYCRDPADGGCDHGGLLGRRRWRCAAGKSCNWDPGRELHDHRDCHFRRDSAYCIRDDYSYLTADNSLFDALAEVNGFPRTTP